MKVRYDGSALLFRCPGCGDEHRIPVNPGWQWNGDLERPTVNPSILVRAGHYAPSWKLGNECWCGKDYGFSCNVCHSFVREGRIEFCADSTHELAGRTVELPDATVEQP